MTLRQYYAGQVLAAVMDRVSDRLPGPAPDLPAFRVLAETICQVAVIFADAMIKAERQ
jgi:hypothetical protein